MRRGGAGHLSQTVQHTLELIEFLSKFKMSHRPVPDVPSEGPVRGKEFPGGVLTSHHPRNRRVNRAGPGWNSALSGLSPISNTQHGLPYPLPGFEEGGKEGREVGV